MNTFNAMKMYLNTEYFLSEEVKQKRRQDWAAFFSRVESCTSNIDIPISSLDSNNISEYLSDDTESKISLPKQNTFLENIKSKNKNFRHKLKKLRKRKSRQISKNWRLLHKVVFNNMADELNITSNSGSSLINFCDKIKNYETNLFDTPNLFHEIRCKQSKQTDKENIDNSKKIESIDSCDIVNTDEKLKQKYNWKHLHVVLETLDYSKNICKRNNMNEKEKDNNKKSQIETNYTYKKQEQETKDEQEKYVNKGNIEIKSLRNDVNIDKLNKCKHLHVVLEKLDYSKNICKRNNMNEKEIDNNKKSQIETNYTYKKQEQERKDEQEKYINKGNIEMKSLRNDVNIDKITKSIECKKDINSISTCNILLESRPCHTETKCETIELCDKLQYSESQNYVDEKQEIKTSNSYNQETNNSMNSTNKRKKYNGFNDTLEQIKKKRKTMTLFEFINQSGTETTSKTGKQKRAKAHTYGDINQINYNDTVIILTLEDFLNDTF